MWIKEVARKHLGLLVLSTLLITFAAINSFISHEARNSVLEMIAGQRLQTIADAQQKYQMHSGGRSYGSFKQLVEAGLLDEDYKSDSPIIDGYRYTMQIESGSGSQQPTFIVNADPYPADNWLIAKSHYQLDSKPAIHINKWGPATAKDPPCCR
ncbi:MAG TPA: hypothetical protein VM914_02010 [Pyrinomonadaceae bacterium]|jgi:hypothetical protein|nr:hypothetical protein [Pyrinomonadaceae bacterium]